MGFILSPANFTVSPTSANGGAVTIVGAWVFYEPLPGFLTADSFTYTIADNLGGSAIGTVTVAILVDNDPAQNLAIVASGADTFDLVGNGIPGRTYRLQSTPSLSSPTWVIVPGGNLTANDVGFFIYPDIPNATTVFYRTVYP